MNILTSDILKVRILLVGEKPCLKQQKVKMNKREKDENLHSTIC